MNDRELDRLTEEYLAALAAADDRTLDTLWERAATDPELERALLEIEVALDEDDREQDARAAERTIAGSVVAHLPSAEIIRPSTGPVTVGDVARELFRHTPDRLSAEAHALNQRLLSSLEELPFEVGLTKLIAWAESRFGTAPSEYWRSFRQAALKLERRRGSEAEYRLAARKAPKPEGPK